LDALGEPFAGFLDYFMASCEEFRVMYDETEA